MTEILADPASFRLSKENFTLDIPAMDKVEDWTKDCEGDDCLIPFLVYAALVLVTGFVILIIDCIINAVNIGIVKKEYSRLTSLASAVRHAIPQSNENDEIRRGMSRKMQNVDTRYNMKMMTKNTSSYIEALDLIGACFQTVHEYYNQNARVDDTI